MPGSDPSHTLGILGFGHFGRALADLAATAGRPWLAADPAAPIPPEHRVPTGAELAARAGTLVLCVPVPALEPIVRDIRPRLTTGHLVLDVGSVKAWPAEVMGRLLGADIPWCATHPLFGPVSLSRGERPLRVVVCPNSQHPRSADLAAAFYGSLGCEVTRQPADDHDRHMAETHALAFFVAKAMLDIEAGRGSDIITPSFRAMAQTVDTVRGDAGHLFSLIQLGNPHAAGARARLLAALHAIDDELRDALTRGTDAGVHQIDPPS
ncbi:MAG: prephenate dehydrogenase [Phycisphaerales bacterium]|nr:prephenate dehydrogenase [Phycisphaerales bacterium]